MNSTWWIVWVTTKELKAVKVPLQSASVCCCDTINSEGNYGTNYVCTYIHVVSDHEAKYTTVQKQQSWCCSNNEATTIEWLVWLVLLLYTKFYRKHQLYTYLACENRPSCFYALLLFWRAAFFEHIPPNKIHISYFFYFYCPTHYCCIPTLPLCLPSHFMCAEIFHIINIDVPADVGAPPFFIQICK